MDEGYIVVDSIAPITVTDVTYDLARESGFESVDELLRIARPLVEKDTYGRPLF